MSKTRREVGSRPSHAGASAPGQDSLPLQPLLHVYCRHRPAGLPELEQQPGWGSRLTAIRSAREQFFNPRFLEITPDRELRPHLERFHEACLPRGFHREVLARRAGMVRHGLMHLLQGSDPLPQRLENCLASRGPYFVAGLGPVFWGALAQALNPGANPSWAPETVAGLRRFGLVRWPLNAGPALVYAGLTAGYAQVQVSCPDLAAWQIDHFLTLVARMRGRELWQGAGSPGEDPVAAVVERLRRSQPLRERLKERGLELARAQELLQGGLAERDAKKVGLALNLADPIGAGRSPLDWGAHAQAALDWVERFWEADDPEGWLRAFWQQAPLPGAGLWLPGAVLHLRDPQRFAPFHEEVRQGVMRIDDSFRPGLPPEDGYRLAGDVQLSLRERYRLHPLEVPALLMALASTEEERGPGSFGGFCADTCRFFEELQENNERGWMEVNRERYRFAVREPLLELCQALARRYVEPVLRGMHGWQLDTEAKAGRALTSICRNAYGRGDPYNNELWIAFTALRGRQPPAGREDAQLFVKLDARGLRYGLRLGRKASAAIACFRHNVQRHTDALWRMLQQTGALDECLFGQAEGSGMLYRLAGPSALWDWAGARSFEIARTRGGDDPLLTNDELVGDILLTFDRLLPALACALEGDVSAFLGEQPAERNACPPRFGAEDFLRETGLSADWLRCTRELLDLKRQLILQGVPGTGKTHVARSLARSLTSGRDDCVRLVQLHPAYSYEEFVEGIKVRSVEVEGRHEVTYPVEPGLLCAFAAEAAAEPELPHVLILDEINRANLPRLFGELLYLLEYRGQSVRLPYSRRDFQLPANLYLLGTMNAADRSVMLLDQALRARFSLVEMHPDARVLSSWLSEHPPAAGPTFAVRVLGLFERLNARLSNDIGPQGQIGHSFFMVPDLDEARLRLIWRHQIWPLLEEHLVSQPRLLVSYRLEELLDEPTRPAGKRRRPAEANLNP